MERASGNRPDEDKPSRSPNSFLQLAILQNSVELGYPVTLTLILKRKVASPQTVNITCSLDLQTYTGNKKTNLGIIQKTMQLQGQGTVPGDSEATDRPGCPPSGVLPCSWITLWLHTLTFHI